MCSPCFGSCDLDKDWCLFLIEMATKPGTKVREIPYCSDQLSLHYFTILLSFVCLKLFFLSHLNAPLSQKHILHCFSYILKSVIVKKRQNCNHKEISYTILKCIVCHLFFLKSYMIDLVSPISLVLFHHYNAPFGESSLVCVLSTLVQDSLMWVYRYTVLI